MQMGVHKDTLAAALEDADIVLFHQPDDLEWSIEGVTEVFNQVDPLIEHLVRIASNDDHILIMSNGGFENIHNRLLDALK
jgi:UDP-N-acetylmuramate: L-alanyl-gamma-D-glutamyl-meso-diaminopimelate ligase